MKVVRNTVDDVKFTFPMMACSVLVAVWRYECHGRMKRQDKEKLRQIQLGKEEQDRIIRMIKGIKK